MLAEVVADTPATLADMATTTRKVFVAAVNKFSCVCIIILALAGIICDDFVAPIEECLFPKKSYFTGLLCYLCFMQNDTL